MPQVLRSARRAGVPAVRGLGRVGWPGGLVLLAWLSACTGGLDWRQLRPEGWSLAMAMPCKPASMAREVSLAGRPVALTLMACTEDRHTYAVASADLADPARVGPSLQALGRSAVDNLQGRIDADQPAAVPGMTPHAEARRWQVHGRLPDGAVVVSDVVVFAHGTRVFQATVIGPRHEPVLTQAFVEALQVRP